MGSLPAVRFYWLPFGHFLPFFYFERPAIPRGEGAEKRPAGGGQGWRRGKGGGGAPLFPGDRKGDIFSRPLFGFYVFGITGNWLRVLINFRPHVIYSVYISKEVG
jgi:hypothetical protein